MNTNSFGIGLSELLLVGVVLAVLASVPVVLFFVIRAAVSAGKRDRES